MPLAYAVDLVIKVVEPRHLQHILNGVKSLALQVDPHAVISQKRPQTILASLVVEPGSINRVTDLVDHYEDFLQEVELHVMTPSSAYLIRSNENKQRCLEELGLSDKTVKLLHKAKISTVHDLTLTTRRHLKVYVRQVGPVKIKEIEDALALEGLSLADE